MVSAQVSSLSRYQNMFSFYCWLICGGLLFGFLQQSCRSRGGAKECNQQPQVPRSSGRESKITPYYKVFKLSMSHLSFQNNANVNVFATGLL